MLEPEDPEQPRPLLILVRDANGALKLAKRSAKAVFCRNCGGMMGDPFQGVTIEKGRFTIEHYGGSAWRWSSNFTFGWSRGISRGSSCAWRVSRSTRATPDEIEKTVHTPPRDFGLIDVTEFDPEDYQGRGKK